MRLAVYYGGTFDPIHCGHVAVAEAARNTFETTIHFLPSADPPHRAPTSASAIQRAAMLDLAIAGKLGLLCDRRELRRQGKSYSVDTLRELRAELGPKTPIAWLIGLDAFLGLDTWHHWRELFELCHFIVVDRPEQSLAHISPTLQSACQARWVDSRQALESKSAGCIYRLPMALRDESSTIARAGIADGFDMGGLLPTAVAEYIKIHHLYASGV